MTDKKTCKSANARLQKVFSHISHDYRENPFKDELIATARTIATEGKGILAADESTGTIAKRFVDAAIPNTFENRRKYRQLLFTTPGLNQWVSGVIMFDETLRQKADDGTPFAELLKKQGIITGIKVDQGLKDIPNTNGEYATQGLTDLDKRCAEYYKLGARFAKWRAALRITPTTPSDLAINETAHSLARYAAICQAHGLVPIVEPEILQDGDHPIETCEIITAKVVTACYAALNLQRVMLEGTLLKPNMVTPGQACRVRASAAEIGAATVRAMQRSVPPAVPGITFLSGGMGEEDATLALNALNTPNLGPRPWKLTFSYGRALQHTVINTWMGKDENIKKAQEALQIRASANSKAQLGQYKGEAANATLSKSLFVAGYTY